MLLNRHAAGGATARLVAPIAAWLAQHAPQATLRAEDGVAAAAAAISAAAPGARIVLVGGDGTLHRMLPALVAHGGDVALVPRGSGNDAARAFGLHGPGWREALALALRGAALPIDLAAVEVDGRTTLFASSLAAGFDGAVATRAAHGPRVLRGMPRYLWATFGELAALRTCRLRAMADGAVVHDGEALFASVLATPSYGGGMPAAPQASITDGRCELLIAGRFDRLGTLAMLPRLLIGAHLGHSRVTLRAAREVVVSAETPVALAADGEPLGQASRWSVRVRPAALRMVLGPRARAAVPVA